MNSRMGLERLRQPRSNPATNMLIAATVLVFALVARTAAEQQSEGMQVVPVAHPLQAPLELGHTLDVRAMLPRLQL